MNILSREKEAERSSALQDERRSGTEFRFTNMVQIIISSVISSVIAAAIIAGFKLLSKSIDKHIREMEQTFEQLRLKIDYMEIKHEALVMALHSYFHNGFYINYKKELERLSTDYEFINKRTNHE